MKSDELPLSAVDFSSGHSEPCLAEQHMGLAHLCARRLVGRGLSYEDLVREGAAALVTVSARYDAARGVAFSTYAVPYLLGCLRRACERASPMHVPEGDRTLLRRVAALRESALRLTGREPTVDALACALHIPAGELTAVLAAGQRLRTLASLDEGTSVPAQAVKDPRTDRFDDYLLLLDVIASLPEPMPQLLRLRFVRCHSQQHTAELMGLSQAQISKLERRAKDALRDALYAEVSEP